MNNTIAAANNTKVASELFATIKAYRPGLKSLSIDQSGIMVATMKSERCCRQVAFDLGLSRAFEGLSAEWNPGSQLFVITARCKGQA